MVSPSAMLNRPNRGNAARSIPPGGICQVSRRASICAANMPCWYTTPLGGPVLPEVKMMAAVSCRRVVVGNGVAVAGASASNLSTGSPGPQGAGPTVILKRARAKRRRWSQRSHCTRGGPMKPAGSIWSRHWKMRRSPMPGSSSTTVAPERKRAKVQRRKSGPGRTARTRRSPGRTPSCRKPSASRSHSASSWAKVTGGDVATWERAPPREQTSTAGWAGNRRAVSRSVSAILNGGWSLMERGRETARGGPVTGTGTAPGCRRSGTPPAGGLPPKSGCQRVDAR